MKTSYLIALISCTLAFASCKKDDQSTQDLLTSKTWKRALNDKNPSTNPQVLIKSELLYYAVQNCEKDDSFKFGSDGKLTINRNTEKCNVNEQENEIQTYTIDRIKKELTIDGVKYVLAEESNAQIKYYLVLPSYNEPRYLIFLLQ